MIRKILLACGVLFAVVSFMIGCLPSSVQKRIENGYGFILPFSVRKEMIYADELGYIILRLPASDIKRMLGEQIPKFSAWQPYKQAMFIGYANTKSFRINGRNSDQYMVAWNYSPTKHKYDKLGVFIDLSRNLLIFYDGITSGY